MSGRITSRTSLEQLKRDAKRWLRALRENDPEARRRLTTALAPAPAPDEPTLRDVQLALARELGFAGWTALRAHLATRAPERVDLDALVARFLDNACPDHHVRSGGDHVRAEHTALRLLDRHPEIAHANLATAVVCGDLPALRRMLAARPELARARDAAASAERAGPGGSHDLVRHDLGPKGWDPLLYLCFTRLSLPAVAENAVAIAELLLDHGADPNSYFMAGDSRYTPLVGAIGEGEENRPPHQRRDELVDLLLARGAEPYDMQVVYDIHFQGRVHWFLEKVHRRSLELGREADWRDPSWRMLDMGGYGNGARWHLWIAIEHGDARLAEWCLAHGADPNAPPPAAKSLMQGPLHDEARRRGQDEIAALLERFGAEPTAAAPLDGVAALTSAAMRLDREAARALVAAHPELLRRAEPLLTATRHDRVDAARLLLDLGTSPDVANEKSERPLHHAAYYGAPRVAELLIEHGAEIDPVSRAWDSTPLGAATYGGRWRLVDIIAPHSRDPWELAYAGKSDRLRELLAEDPSLARVRSATQTPLMWLAAGDESVALEIARLLLDHGADPTVVNEHGMTAADIAARNGMDRVAEMLREGLEVGG